MNEYEKIEREKEQERIIEQYSNVLWFNSLITAGTGTYFVGAGTFASVIGG
jgi:hypothetical protein